MANVQVWRKLSLYSYHTTSSIGSYCSAHRCISSCTLAVWNSSTQDVISSVVTTSKDHLLHSLRTAENHTALMKMVNMHYPIMNDKHIIQTLRTLFELLKCEESQETKIEIIRSMEFQKLCSRLKSQSRSLDMNEIVEALKIVSYMGVPSSSTIVQILLQMLRHSVNDLSLSQIVFLEFVLKKFDNCPLVDALKIALPIVFEVQLSAKLDRCNVTHLAEMLHYAVKQNLSNTTLSLLLDCLVEVTQKMDVKSATSIARSLVSLDRPLLSLPFLLRQSLNIVSRNINELSFDEVEILLRKLVSRYLKTSEHFYHEDFVDSSAAYVIQNHCDLEKASWILKKLTRIGHTNIGLLDYIAEEAAKYPDYLQNAGPTIVFTTVTGMSNADYKPVKWDVLKENILKNKLLEAHKIELPWMKFSLELASLGCFHTPLVQRVFGEEFLRKYLARDNNLLDHLQLLLLYQAVATLFSGYDGPFPPDAIIQKASRINGDNVTEFPLKAALEHGLGGPSYLQTRYTTKLGHFIDHVVVMRKGGYPVAVNAYGSTDSSRSFIEDLIVPPDSQIILILLFHKGCYSVNSRRLRGHFSLICRTLESMGYAVIAISHSAWLDLPDFEKIPYLMQKIKLKCDSADCEATVVQ